MKQCPQCGAQYSNENQFCRDDGADLVVIAEPSPGGAATGDAPPAHPQPVASAPANAPQFESRKQPLSPRAFAIGVLVLFGAGLLVAFVENRRETAHETRIADQQNSQNGDAASEDEPPPPPASTTAPPTRSDARFTDCAASASKWMRSEQGYDYRPSVVLDGLKDTAWNVENNNHGRGEWIQLSWPGERTVTRIGVIVGYEKINLKPQYKDQPQMWFRNNRLKAATLLFSNGGRIRLSFDDKTGMQYREFSPVRARWVRLIVDDVYLDMYGGLQKRWDDVAISEIQVWGRA